MVLKIVNFDTVLSLLAMTWTVEINMWTTCVICKTRRKNFLWFWLPSVLNKTFVSKIFIGPSKILLQYFCLLSKGCVKSIYLYFHAYCLVSLCFYECCYVIIHRYTACHELEFIKKMFSPLPHVPTFSSDWNRKPVNCFRATLFNSGRSNGPRAINVYLVE